MVIHTREHLKMKSVGIIGLLISLSLVLLPGCNNTRLLPDEEASRFATEIDALSENLLASLNSGDYDRYIRDMDQTMKEASTPADFESLHTLLAEKIGAYESRKMVQVVEQEGLRVVIYDAKFEKEDSVTIRVVFNTTGESPLISGLWLDSPRLRQK